MALAQAHVIVHGIVQGVAFRYYTYDMAGKLDLSGWVRNRRDGTVEAVFAGKKEGVDAMIDWCGHGPPSAEVDKVDVEWQSPTAGLRGFRIIS